VCCGDSTTAHMAACQRLTPSICCCLVAIGHMRTGQQDMGRCCQSAETSNCASCSTGRQDTLNCCISEPGSAQQHSKMSSPWWSTDSAQHAALLLQLHAQATLDKHDDTDNTHTYASIPGRLASNTYISLTCDRNQPHITEHAGRHTHHWHSSTKATRCAHDPQPSPI
jgi:hypothetical protein